MGSPSIRAKREVLAVSAVLILGSLFVLLPFLDALILAVATSYLLRFAHKKLDSRLNDEFLSTIIIIVGLLGFISLAVYFSVSNFNTILGGVEGFSGTLENKTAAILDQLDVSQQMRDSTKRVIDQVSRDTRSELIEAFTNLPGFFIDLGIYLVASIYLYKDGPKIKRKVDGLLEDMPENEKRIINSLMYSIDSIFKGVFVTQFLVALILAMVAAVGFWLISLATSPMPLIPLWAFLIGITALLPLIANFMVYGPIGVYYVLIGTPLKGFMILGYGLLVLQIMPEIFLRPYIGSWQMDEHPLIIFMGFIAGPLALGLKGFILGPLLLILAKEFTLNYTDLVSVESD